MPLPALVWSTFIFWVVLYYLRSRRQRSGHGFILPGNSSHSQRNDFVRFNLHGKLLLVNLRNLHVKLETNLVNEVHQTLTDTLSKDGALKSAVKLLYNTGVLAGIAGLILGTAFLAANALRIVGRVLLEVSTDAAYAAIDQFAKRGVGGSVSGSTQTGSFDVYAIIPGITVPWSHFPLIIAALLTSQIIHEAGHFVSAALDTIPVESIGIALTVVFPSAFVALSGTPTNKDKISQLRVIAAGAWHNLLTWAVLYLLASFGFGRAWTYVGYQNTSDNGVVVVDVENGSLAHHISAGNIITALDDTSLTRSMGIEREDVWTRYLLTPVEDQVPLERGWCVEANWYNDRPQNCCQPGDRPSLPPVAQLSCFLSSRPTRTFDNATLENGRCIDPVPLLVDNTDEVTRCFTAIDCSDERSGEEMECVRPDVNAQLLRVTVESGFRGDKSSKVVLWGGPRSEVWEQVTVGNFAPRWQYLPIWLPIVVSLFFSYLSTLSLSLFFFNLLVLPSLDGSQFFSTILAYISEYHAHDDGISLDIEAYGLPDNTLNSQMSRTRRFLRRWKASIERGMRYFTIGLCSISLVGLLVS